jgi:hypothetical protein
MDKDTLKKGIDIAAEVYTYAKGVFNSIRGKRKKLVSITKEYDNGDGVESITLTTYENKDGSKSYEKSVVHDSPKVK